MVSVILMFWYLWNKKKSISVYSRLTISLLSLGWTMVTMPPAIGETVLEKIIRTGKLTAGTSKDAQRFLLSLN